MPFYDPTNGEAAIVGPDPIDVEDFTALHEVMGRAQVVRVELPYEYDPGLPDPFVRLTITPLGSNGDFYYIGATRRSEIKVVAQRFLRRYLPQIDPSDGVLIIDLNERRMYTESARTRIWIDDPDPIYVQF